MRVTVVDNYDSFTYNLVEYVSDLEIDGERPTIEVLKNAASLAEVRDTDPDALLISPGPGHPKNDRDVGVTMPVLRELSPEVPTLGVCLGLEAAVYEYGGSVGHAPEPIHGKAFPVDHDGAGVFTGLEQGFRAGRYHSLVATSVPDCFEVSATTDHRVPAADADEPAASRSGERGASGDAESLVMGVRHREHPIEAVQFHPESVLTAVGHDVIRNFLIECV
ncbi:aminodeoxychorismate/anthranilate synthase component II [Halorarum halophilum]|uniref:anthranilate synthase n=1 Tax=Halorarum halophilum TaxID=2743090 RepID=A0A7D5KX77_9EURY|nr:anthranilate synthase component II [Halobaculum halophilum]QLG27838.1 aminodeoxychorismate/anthranilate synthase component II [Halobaculum halophilum]